MAESDGLKTIPKIFYENALKYGDKAAFREKKYGLWEDISWTKYYECVRYIASALISMGLDKGDRVCIFGDNCYQWVTIDMAVQCSGGISIGIYYTSPSYQLEYIINNSESKFLFVKDSEYLDKWLKIQNNTPSLNKVIAWNIKGLKHYSHPKFTGYDELIKIGKEIYSNDKELIKNRINEIKAEDLSLISYTAVTSGLSKGAVITHDNIMSMAKSLSIENLLNKTDEILSFMPLSYIFERILSVFCHSYKGYTVNFIERENTIMENMTEISPTFSYATPRIWEKYCGGIIMRMGDASWLKRKIFDHAFEIGKKRVLKKIDFKKVPFYLESYYKILHFLVFRKMKEKLGFERLKIAYSSGAPISYHILIFFQALGVNLLEGYGQTETCGITCLSRSGHEKYGTVGKPFSETEITIAKDGEILVKNKWTFKGYYKDEQDSANTLEEGWLHSGDLGEIDDDGYIKITGRKKDITITSGGMSVNPNYIEKKLKESPYIEDAILLGDGKQFLSCIISTNDENVSQYCKEQDMKHSYEDQQTRKSRINILIQKEIDKINDNLSRAEQIKRFTVIADKLYSKNSCLTPTMKIKRRYATEAYKDLLDNIYKDRRGQKR